MNIKAVLQYVASSVLAALVMVATAAQADVPNAPTKPIEQKYYANGPWAVTTVIGIKDQAGNPYTDSAGNKFDVYYPTNLGQGGFKHPIITYGNGTAIGTPYPPTYFLTHLASWGFVVVVDESGSTGLGQPIVEAAFFMALQSVNSSSPFYNKLDTAHIGAIGHSQGAYGVVNAMINAGGMIKTIVSLEEPQQVWCNPDCGSTARLTSGSVFYVNGSLDIWVSPSTHDYPCTPYVGPWISGENSNQCFYNDTPNSLPKVWATLIGADHNDILGSPGCVSSTPAPCNNGVYGYLGYPTAWMMDKLQGDTYAHQAFINGTGELFQETVNWQNQHSNIYY